MRTQLRSADARSPLDILVKQAPVVTGVLALGAGLTAAGDADAALIIQNINQTASNSNVQFDLDQNGIKDFSVGAFGAKGNISKLKSTLGAISRKDLLYAVQLGFNEQVDADLFNGTVGSSTSFAELYDGTSGPWGTVGAHGFVPLFLEISGATHYGWVEITRGSAIVGRAGFQSDANVAAMTPVPLPGSLALLATGAASLLALRRRKRAIAAEPHP